MDPTQEVARMPGSQNVRNVLRARWGVILVAALCAVVLLPRPTTAANYRVRAQAGNVWDPDFRHILKGDRITWRNPTSRTHNLKAIGSKWNKNVDLRPGELTRKRFKRNGTFRFRCRLHSQMVRQDDGTRRCSGMCGVIHVGKL